MALGYHVVAFLVAICFGGVVAKSELEQHELATTTITPSTTAATITATHSTYTDTTKAFLATTTTTTTTGTTTGVCDYSEQACRKKVIEMGLRVGGADYPFAGNFTESGCYFYTTGNYANEAYYGYLNGTGITAANQLTRPSAPKVRIDTCKDTKTTTTAKMTTTTTTTTTGTTTNRWVSWATWWANLVFFGGFKIVALAWTLAGLMVLIGVV